MIFIKSFIIFTYNYQVLTPNNLINLNDIQGHSAIDYLIDYDGINPYLRKLKHEYSKNKKLSLTLNNRLLQQPKAFFSF